MTFGKICEMRTLFLSLYLMFAGITGAVGQLTIVSSQLLPLGADHRWSMPQWSPDGSALFYTTDDFNGIWRCSLRTGTSRLVTSDLQSGYGFSISSDGTRIAYRRTLSNAPGRSRLQEAVVKTLADDSEIVLSSASDVALPSFAQSDAVYTIDGRTMGVTSASRNVVTLLGVEGNKIVLLRDGVRVLLDPLGGDGRYIWPALSPDGSRLVAQEMERGSFVADAGGTNPLRIGRRDAAVWTRDGRWLVYMDDRDDGHRVTGSEIACVSPDGKVTAQITSTPGVMEMYPRCSPVDDLIVCSSLEGEIIILRYAEAGR